MPNPWCRGDDQSGGGPNDTKGLRVFIGRREILDELQRQDSANSFVADIRGDLGTGRTALLRHLDFDHHPALRSVLVDLADFNPDHPGQVGDKASVGAVQANFGEYAKLLQFLIDRAAPGEAGREMARAIQTARNKEVAGRVTSIETSLKELGSPFAPRALSDAWRRAAESISSDFLRLWGAHGQGSMLLLDNFDTVTNQEIGTWLTVMIGRPGIDDMTLGRTVVVLTRSAFDSDPCLSGDHVKAWVLSNLNRDEVAEYVRTYRGRESGRDTVDLVHTVSQGHPATLRLVCDLLWGAKALAAVDQNSEEVILDLPRPQTEKAAALVEKLVERLGVPGLMEAIEAAAVPRRFDVDMLAALLTHEAENGTIDKTQRDQFERIRELPFVEATTSQERELRIHDYARASLIARMETLQSQRLQSLHERAEAYYQRLLAKDFIDERGQARAYGDWYFLESPEWRSRKREWLYHLARLSERKKQRSALLEAARLFLDAFWWWGNYVHFDFCDRLVADLGQILVTLDNGSSVHGHGARWQSAWVDLGTLHQGLQEMLDNYPLRSQKSPDARWDLVESALLKIRRACGLVVLPARSSRRQRHIAALMNVFLAHTYRYRAEGPGNFLKADGYYQKAEALFRQNDDQWNWAWIAFERADLHIEEAVRSGHATDPEKLNRAISLASPAVEFVQPKPESDGPSFAADDDSGKAELEDADEETETEAGDSDHELMSNLHRMRGDIAQHQGKTEHAAVCYGRSAIHAYLFHMVGGPPDEYTLQFYVDIRARAIQLLACLWESGQRDMALRCAELMWREVWRTSMALSPPRADDMLTLLPGIREGKAVPLTQLLFPRGPEIEEVGKEVSEFTRQHDLFTQGLDSTVSRDLHENV